MEDYNHQSSIDVLKIYGLGQFLIRYNNFEKDIDDWTSDKALKMFKYFLINRNKEIFNEELVEVFWPDIDPATGQKRLYNTIYLLRKNIGIKDIVLNKTSCYKFNNKYSCWIDWEQFNQIYNNLNNDLSIDKLKKALDLYKGDLFPGLRYEDWVEDIRTNLKEKYLDLIYQLSKKLYEKGEYIESLVYLKKGINEELYREEYYELAMKILAETGRVYEALSVFEKYQKLIKNDLDIEPGVDIVNTYKKIKNCDLIQSHTYKEEQEKGALRCDRNVFNKIFELENRQVKRANKNFTFLEIDFSEVNMETDFNDICEDIGELFRSGDVICCHNKKINVLLHDMNVEKTYFILNRIFEFLKQKNIKKKPEFDFKEITGE